MKNILIHSNRNLLRFATVFLIAQLVVTPTLAETIGEVIRSSNMPDYPSGMEIETDTEIETGAGQRVAVKTTQGDVLIANSNSKIKIVKPGFFSQLFGKVFYFFTPRQEENATVQTPTATIGIRGTKFLVESEEGENATEKVSLVEGELNLEPNDGEGFALYRQRELTEFELFKREQMDEFDAFKQQLAEEFVAYKQSIDLNAGFALAIDGKKATQIPLDENIDAEIAEFEAFISANQLQ